MSPATKRSSPSSTIPKISLAEEDDDLDDLDDVLNQFGTSKVPGPPPNTSALQPPSSSTGRPRQNTRVDGLPPSLPGSSASNLASTSELSEVDEDKISKDFADELAKGMESLMRELVIEPGTVSEGGEEGKERSSTLAEGDVEEDERFKKFKAAWEAALIEGLDENDAARPESPAGMANERERPAGTYHEGLRQAMNKIKEGESKLQSSSGSGSATATAGAGSIPPDFESLLRLIGDPNAAGSDPGDGDEEKELIGFLETMMNQLLSKEVLYEPLKELSQGFPGYLANPPKPLSQPDIERFKNQQLCVQKVLTVFENPEYKDGHPEHSKTVIELMGELQTYGSPPPEIMGELPPGLDKLGGPGEECIIS